MASLADEAIIALAEVRAIGEKLGDEHPMRHAVRNIKRVAEDILTQSLRQVTDLSYQAERLVKDFDKLVSEKQGE